jgi:DNA-binding protein H-NS
LSQPEEGSAEGENERCHVRLNQKKLGMHTDLKALSIEDLHRLDGKVSAELQRRRKSLQHSLILIDANLTPAARRGPKKGSKAEPKYVGPQGETWSGRGLKPRWLTTLLKVGHTMEEFAVQ